MTTPTDNLTDRELDAAVARGLGHVVSGANFVPGHKHYSTSDDACREIEAWCREHGMEREYWDAVRPLILAYMDNDVADAHRLAESPLGFEYVFATHEQKCRAFLAVLEQMK